MRLNIGGGPKKLEGYLNLDAQEWDGATDIIQDITQYPYYYTEGAIIDDNTVDEVLAVEVLEHIGFRETVDVLKEWHRLLKPGGLLHIQVPDCGEMALMYARRQICDCVPRKAASYEDYRADPNCPKCEGRAFVHPERWKFAFTGAQKHRFDVHKNIFTSDYMEMLLKKVGFKDIEFYPNIYKIVVKCIK